MGRRALIFGSTGQDGQLMRELLLRHGYTVVGRRRFSVSAVAASDPDEVYVLGGLSSVARSFKEPAETFESNVGDAWRLLEQLRLRGKPARVCFAGSSESLGEVPSGRASEDAPPRPVSPYGYAKAMLRDLVASYREIYGVFAATAVLFNHTSHMQRDTFIVPRILAGAKRDATLGRSMPLVLGNVEVARDWGWAPDYVRAMHAMLSGEQPRDYVVATGETHTIRDVVDGLYLRMGLEPPRIVTDQNLLRPRDLARTCGDPSLLREHMGWRPVDFERLLDYVVSPPADTWDVNDAVKQLDPKVPAGASFDVA